MVFSVNTAVLFRFGIFQSRKTFLIVFYVYIFFCEVSFTRNNAKEPVNKVFCKLITIKYGAMKAIENHLLVSSFSL